MKGGNIKRITSLDGLRGLAAIGVAFFYHFNSVNINIYPFVGFTQWLYSYGLRLVDFFFILSGFILTYVYRAKISEKTITFKAFIVKRLTRLYPLHLITLLVVALGQYALKTNGYEYYVYRLNNAGSFLQNLLLVQYGWIGTKFSFNGPSWSISLEYFVYIVFFFYVYYFGLVKKKILYVLPVIFGLIVAFTFRNYPILNKETARIVIGFFSGVVLFDVYKLIEKRTQTFKNYLSLGLIVSIVCAFSFQNNFTNFELFNVYPISALGVDVKTYVIYFVSLVFLFPPLILVVLIFDPIEKILSSRFFKYLGDLSYSIYMWHFPVKLGIYLFAVFVSQVDVSSYRIYFLYILLVMAVSTVSYYFYEVPAKIKLRKYLGV